MWRARSSVTLNQRSTPQSGFTKPANTRLGASLVRARVDCGRAPTEQPSSLVVRFSAEPEEGFEAAWHIPEWADGSGADMDAFDACLTRAYDAACLARGGPKDHWLPNCDGSRRNVEARDFFAFRYQAGDAIFAEFMDDFELSENMSIFGMEAGNM